MVLPVSLEDLLATRSAVIVADVATPRAFDGYHRYALVDRGSYDFIDEPDAPELVARAAALIEQQTGDHRRCVESRVVRLVPGDYLLAHHDRIRDRGLEVVFDLSPAAAPAELHYRQHGQVFFRMPCVPGSAALIPRNPTVTSNHTYLSKLHTGEVVRWIALFV